MNVSVNVVNVMSEFEVLKSALAVGWVKFAYRKADGTKRIAIGTTNRALVEYVFGRRLRAINQSFYDNGGYFDLVRCEWRKFNPDRLIGIMYDKLNDKQAVAQAVSIVYSDGDMSMLDVEVEVLRSFSGRIIGLADTEKIFNVAKNVGLNIVNREIDDEQKSEIIIAKVNSVYNVMPPKASFGGVHVVAEIERPTRADLIAELHELRERESEILRILLH